MNKKRREIIRTAVETISQSTSMIEGVLDQEVDALDNWPENLQNTERYIRSEDAVDNLESATSLLKEALPYLEEVIGG